MKAVYKAKDGREFDSSAAAEWHDGVLERARMFEESRDALFLALARSALTADGQPFNPKRTDYFRVVNFCGKMPRMLREEVWWYECVVESCSTREKAVAFRRWDRDRWTRIEISDLYHSEAEARRSLLSALQRYADEVQAEIERVKALML